MTKNKTNVNIQCIVSLIDISYVAVVAHHPPLFLILIPTNMKIDSLPDTIR